MSRAEKANIEAADWLIAQDDGPLSPQDQERFEAWLEESGGNKAAYWRLELGWAEADRIGALGHREAERREIARPRRLLKWWVPTSIAASIALVLGVQNFVDLPAASTPSSDAASGQTTVKSYATPVGGKRLVDLADGSRIQLNTQSKVRTVLTTTRRQVWLDRGEVFFEVAHREHQPFVVHAGDRKITVLGTKFSVRREGEKVIVTVLEGRVRVDEVKHNELLRSSIMVGGEIAMAEGAATLLTPRSEIKVENALAWRHGMLSFDEKPLPAIAAEFNRYNAKKLLLDGDAVGAIRITGTFPSDKPDAFARLLRDAYGLEVNESESEIRVSR